ncbi:hypothetical protein NQ314_000656 [Rhamnusium bicolor]|uniref:HTH CENPB-type domain-containing protein n=1 Tax=Rhamnusium bicolor TaxID=1586634 RepID=A0AAV8ZWH7_9CUCU|nr:hypothetical protein NQ314_000656 [Rhamnusium bicolor]
MERKRNKGKIYQYSAESLHNVLAAIHDGMSVLRASKTFQIPRTTLRDKLAGRTPLHARRVGPECQLGKHVEEKLVEWIVGMAARGFPVNKEGLLYSVKKLVEEANMETGFVNKTPGKKWLELFLKRHPIVRQKHAEYINKARASVTEEKIREWFSETTTLLGKNIDILNFPAKIWNMDETAMFLSPKGALILAERGKSTYDITTTSEKENVTTLITVNAEGEIAPSLTIFKYDRLPAAVSNAAPPGWGIGKSDSGWMQSETFFEYFSNVFFPYLQQKNTTFPIVVFLDGHASHLSLNLGKFCREREKLSW